MLESHHCMYISLHLDIFVRFQYSQYNVSESAGSVDVTFEVLREVTPGSGVYVPANYTFDFQLLVKTVGASATGVC